MAVTPMFVSSTAELKKKLRLSGVPLTSDAAAIIDEEILTAGLVFRSRLEASTITTIQQTVYSESPSTEAQVLRLQANVLETMLVRRGLLRKLPMAFVDGSGNGQEMWNDEGLSRDASDMDLTAELARLDAEIEEAFELLIGTDVLGDTNNIHAGSIGPSYVSSLGSSLGGSF